MCYEMIGKLGKILLKVKFFIILLSFFILNFFAEESRGGSPEQELNRLDHSVNRHELWLLKRMSQDQIDSLSPSLRRLYKKRLKIKRELERLSEAYLLKQDLLHLLNNLPGTGESKEAGLISLTIVERLETLRKKYTMLRPAALHNIFINVGLKKEGFCWHWTRDLLQALQTIPLKHFQLQWVTAKEGTWGEHNALAISPFLGREIQESDLSQGLLIDGWRNSGQPFWIKISKDHYPWHLGQWQGN